MKLKKIYFKWICNVEFYFYFYVGILYMSILCVIVLLIFVYAFQDIPWRQLDNWHHVILTALCCISLQYTAKGTNLHFVASVVVVLSVLFITQAVSFLCVMGVGDSAHHPGDSLLCYCDPCPEHTVNSSCTLLPQSECYAAVTVGYSGEPNIVLERRTWGCLPPKESALMQVVTSFVELF